MTALETYLSQVTEKDTAKVIDALGHLADFKDVRAVTAIQNAFFHHAPRVRHAAAQAAGENLDDALLEALLSLLDDKDPQVRLAAVTAAGKFADKGHREAVVLALLERQPEPQTEKDVRDIILAAGSGAVPILESELNSLDEKRRKRAIDLLPDMGDLGVMTLITNLPNLNLWESNQTAKKLGGLDHPMLVDYFLEMLKDPELDKRRFAMTAVGGGRTTLKSIHTVGQVLLTDPDQRMRLDAAFYLKWAKHPLVLTYLDQYDPRKEKGLYGRWIREITRDTRVLLDLQEKPLIEVLALLFAGEKHERPLASVEISRREDPIAIPFLADALLNESDHDAQGHILVSLADLEAVEAVDVILAFFHGSYTNNEDALALRTLGRLYHPKALPYLRQRAAKPILNDISAEKEPIESARSAVKMAEERMSFMKTAWFTLMDEDEDNKRIFIALQLAMRGDDRGIDLLMRTFWETDSRAIRCQTLRALGESGSVFVLPFLKDVLHSPDERLVWHALNAIGQLPLEKAPAEVNAMLLDESPLVRMAALFALGRLKDSVTIPSILNRLGDPDPYVRAVALLALQKFPFDPVWLPRLDPLLTDDCAWVRLETARLLLRELRISSREGLSHMLRDENQQIRFFATKLAVYFLAEDLRPALAYCSGVKGGSARRNARQLLKRLDWQEWAKDPELLKQKKAEARREEQNAASRKPLRSLRQETKDILKALKTAGWESLMVTEVAGSAYVDWEVLYSDLQAGEDLTLKREPGNPHDDNAILVLDKAGNKLGYIPTYRNRALAQRLDAGENLRTILLQVNRDARVGQLHIEVFVRDEGKDGKIE
jgi:HEAT repeat protein